MTGRFVFLDPLGNADLRVGIVVSDSSSEDPFERSGRQTLWCRRIRAVVVSASGAVLEECVLHLPTEDIGESSGVDLDRRWARLHEILLRVREGGAEGHFPELVLPGAEAVDPLPPLVYCSVPGKFFALPCRRCLKPLQTSRNDAFLAGLDLPIYGASSIRVLICPQCASKLKRPTLVDPRPESPLKPSGASVLNAREYLDGLSGVLTGEKIPEGSGGVCCASCPEREQCWTWTDDEGASFEMQGLDVVGSASQGPRWRVFTTHSVPYLLTRPAMIPLESFVQQVGSETARVTEGEAAHDGENLLFTFDGSGMDAVEILTLRLTAFGQAVRAVREHHRLFGGAHLDISSESLVVATEKPAPGLPALWRFRVRLEATSALDSLKLSEGVAVGVPPQDPVAPFFSPTVRDFLLTGNRAGELKVDRITPESEGFWRIEGHLLDPRGVFPKPSAEDWVRLQWAEDPSGLGVLEAVARVDPREEGKGGRGDVVLTTEPLALEKSAVDKIQRVGGVHLPNVTYRVFPTFGPKDDLFSLGVVLFLCVLVNDSQDLGLVTDDLGLLSLEDGGKHEWSTRARDQIARHPETWGPSAVLFDAIDRSGDRPNSIPEKLWIEILTLGLRMVAAAPDLVVEGEDGAVLFDRVGGEVDAVLRRLRALLFDRQPLNMEIQTVVSELLAEE